MPTIFDNSENNTTNNPSLPVSPTPVQPTVTAPPTEHPQPVGETSRLNTAPTSGDAYNPEEKATSTRPSISSDDTEKIEKLGAYVKHPKAFHFATQERGETVIFFLRKHPLTQVGWVLLLALLIIGTPFVFVALGIFVPITLPDQFKIVLFIFWYLILFAAFLTKYLLWYYNINIVTDRRVVDIDIPYLLTQEINATLINQIEDVTYNKIGLFTALFNYGNVHVQTAGSVQNIEFLQVPNPQLVVKTILYLMSKIEGR